MVPIAQLVERRIVIPDVTGSSPVGHPITTESCVTSSPSCGTPRRTSDTLRRTSAKAPTSVWRIRRRKPDKFPCTRRSALRHTSIRVTSTESPNCKSRRNPGQAHCMLVRSKRETVATVPGPIKPPPQSCLSAGPFLAAAAESPQLHVPQNTTPCTDRRPKLEPGRAKGANHSGPRGKARTPSSSHLGNKCISSLSSSSKVRLPLVLVWKVCAYHYQELGRGCPSRGKSRYSDSFGGGTH